MTPPKVFVSHATEDKDRFVNKFALRLRENGVDAWLDKWEMLPGDSLVDKIYGDGLKEALTVIIVLSSNSVSKPWVREELNASVIAKIQKGTRLIPVVIDECEVPEALKSTLYEKINDLLNYDENFERIKASIFGESIKPKIGNVPAYVSAVLHSIVGLEPIDNLVLKKSCEYLLDNPYNCIDPNDLFGKNNHDAPPRSEVLDSIKILEDNDYLKVSRGFGGGPEYWGCHYNVTLLGFDEYCKVYVPDYGNIVDKCAGLIGNNEVNTNFKLRDSLNIPLMIANHIIRLLENNGYVKLSGEMGERILIYEVSPKLRRALQ